MLMKKYLKLFVLFGIVLFTSDADLLTYDPLDACTGE